MAGSGRIRRFLRGSLIACAIAALAATAGAAPARAQQSSSQQTSSQQTASQQTSQSGQAQRAPAQTVTETTPQNGSTEIQIWTGAGHSSWGGNPGTVVWNAGFRYGWVVTEAHGPSVLRGRFEYAIDAVPMYVIFQPTGPVYGVGINPFALKWLFDSSRRVAPYFDLGGGVLFTSNNVPAGISRINFASGPAIGVNVGHGKAHWSLEVRWLHISDAGLTMENPGINTIQIRAGIGWFQRKE